MLASEVNPRFIVGLLTILVILLHLSVLIWLLQSNDPVTVTKPLKVIEVAMVSVPSPKSAAAPPAPAPPKPVPPKKPPVKPPVKKKIPIIDKPLERPTPKPIVTEQPVSTPTVAESAKSPEQPTSSQPTVSQSSKPTGNTKTVETDTKTVVSGVVPLVRVPPRYPPRAANRHIEGSVTVEFTISTTGTVTDAVVIDAEPDDIFNDAALTAIEKWKFKEKVVNGVAVTQRAVQVLKFNLMKE